jgi:hypothetical protein
MPLISATNYFILGKIVFKGMYTWMGFKRKEHIDGVE